MKKEELNDNNLNRRVEITFHTPSGNKTESAILIGYDGYYGIVRMESNDVINQYPYADISFVD